MIKKATEHVWVLGAIIAVASYIIGPPSPESGMVEVTVPSYVFDTPDAPVIQPVRKKRTLPSKPSKQTSVPPAGTDYFRIVITETKRREAMGRPGSLLHRYKDGANWAIGYGCHIKYLSPAWKSTIKKQGWKVSEAQARQIMYEVFDGLDKQIKADLPHLSVPQRWAVKSLSFNWGYGNVKRSRLWKYLKSGETGSAVAKAWMRTQAGTENHRISRRMEIALWNGDASAVKAAHENAYRHLERRGDFKHY